MDICDECVAEDFSTCDCCGELTNNDNLTYIEFTDERVCGSCLENKYAYVDTEDDYYPIEKVNVCVCGRTYLIEEGDKGLCPDCIEEETGDE